MQCLYMEVTQGTKSKYQTKTSWIIEVNISTYLEQILNEQELWTLRHSNGVLLLSSYGSSDASCHWWPESCYQLSRAFTAFHHFCQCNQDARATWPLVIRCSFWASWSTKSPICYHLIVTVALKKQAFEHSTASNFLSDIASWSPLTESQHGSIPTESWQVANCTSPKLAQGARILGAVQSTRWMTLRNKNGEERLHTSTTVENLNDFYFFLNIWMLALHPQSQLLDFICFAA